MQFNSEEELQKHCLTVLQHKGVDCAPEVWCGGIRADIVTPDAVYELKKVLDRDALYQALGQATAYNQTLQRPKIRIVGQLPANPKDKEQARNIAMELQRNSTIEVSFIEEDPYWQVQESTTSTPIGHAVVLPSRPVQGREGFQNFQSGNSRGSGKGKERSDLVPPGLFLVIALLEIAIVLGASVWADFTQPAAYSNSTYSSSNNSNNQENPSTTSNTTSNTTGNALTDLSPPVAPSPQPTMQQPMQQPMQQAMAQPEVDDLPQQEISDCNKMGKGANLRKYPSLSGKVLTVIPIGDVVSLTGERVKADGIQWRGVKYRSDSFHRSGWIAGCFL